MTGNGQRIGGSVPGTASGHPVASVAVRLPVRDLERAAALVGDKDAIRLMASLLDANGVAALWGCSPDFVKDLGRRGILPRVKLGRLVKYRVLDVIKAIENRTVHHPTSARTP